VRLSLFITCINDTMFPRTGQAVVTLLERLGHEVQFPQEQTCCGQAHINTGYRRDAMPLLRRFLRVFGGTDRIVVPSASCAGTVRDLYVQLADEVGDAALQRDVADVAARTHELSELLVHHLGLEDVGAFFPYRVAYHPTCHSMRVLRLGDAPMRLLRAVRGISLIPLPDAAECCGFGGTFSVKNEATSVAMLADKTAALLTTGAEYCVAADNSCLMHIGGGTQRAGAPIQMRHLAEILASTEQELFA